MISHLAYQLACRTKALTLSVCTTGPISMSATTTGYVRATGSFVTDGFAQGMELVASGFTSGNNGPCMITSVTPTTITVNATLAVDAAAGGRTLAVGLPSQQAWEGRILDPVNPTPYVTEQYLPGPTVKITGGPLGVLTAEPQYVLTLFAPANNGITVLAAMADAVLTLFAPSTDLALTSGDTLRVRGDVGPYRGQLLPDQPGWARTTVTIPLRCYTTNSL